MPIKSDDPLRRVTLNLYEADCKWLEREYGRGWTERIRQHIHNEVLQRQLRIEQPPKFTMLRRTIGDLADD